MAIHPYILRNGEIRRASDPCLLPGQLGLLAGWGVFSTLRVMDGVLFAWERHWARMSRDARLMNVPMPASPERLQADLLRLVEANGIFEGTMRLVVVRNNGGVWAGPGSEIASDTIALTTGLKEWGESVKLGIQHHGRYAASDFTRAKILSWSENLRWAEQAQEKGFDEVVLLNESNRVAECTSANIFAVFGNDVFTPPLSDGCLPGITRELLLEEVRVPGIKVSERPLKLEELYAADEVFITSTTRDLLPVREIAGGDLNRNDAVRKQLSSAFHDFLVADIARRRQVLLAAVQ